MAPGRKPDNDEATERQELDLDVEEADLEAIVRDAVEAVEAVAESGERGNVAASQLEKAEAAEEAEIGEGDPQAGVLEAELVALRLEVGELRESSIRHLAELENVRKRSAREQQDLRRYAIIEPVKAFLEVVDNLERALSARGSADDLKLGVDLTLRQLEERLKHMGVEPVDPGDTAFDPNLHEAVAKVEDTEVSSPRVSKVLQRGYRIHDRLLRPARVMVAVPLQSPSVVREGEDEEAVESAESR